MTVGATDGGAVAVDPARVLDGLAVARPVIVAIPVHNGGSAVATCLASVLRWTHGARIVVLDDCSTDPEVVALLEHLAATTRAELIRFSENRGYTRTANHALHLDDESDVVLLNSDTEVGPMWLQRLRWVAASRPDVATVSALSDNAGAMAMPDAGVANDWPDHLPWSEVARAVARADLPFAVETPTGHGFCMLVRREAVRRVGVFDEELFPRGYGEENDFCQRAIEAGMVNLVAPHAFVRHEKSQSFGVHRTRLVRDGRAAVDERHPGYTAAVGEWMASDVMSDVRTRFRSLREELAAQPAVLPTRLYVIHRAGGGTPATNADLMDALQGVQDGYLVEAEASGRLTAFSMREGTISKIDQWRAASPFLVTDTFRRDYSDVMSAWIIGLGIELVHVRHLINQPLTSLPEVCSRLGVPFVLSTHDFYMACPSVHLLDENMRFCGGRCTPGGGRCWTPTSFVAGAPSLKHEWIHEWRRRAASVFAQADQVIATTDSARSIMLSSFPQLAGQIKTIEHGREVGADWSPVRRGPRLPGPLRVVAVANWSAHKGVQYLKDMATVLGDTVEWHIFGQRSDLLDAVGVNHGPFSREAFPSLMRELDPDLVALVSIWPETYSHTLTEAWSLGVPVICTDIGAVAERVRRNGGGVVVPLDDARAAASQVAAFAARPEQLDGLRVSVPRQAIRSRTAMAEDYREVYERLHTDRPVIGYVVPEVNGRFTGAAHVRVLRRLISDGVAGQLIARRVVPEEVLRTGRCDVDVLLVQRAAIPGTVDLDRFIAAVRASGARLVVEMDDDVLTRASIGRLSGQPSEDERLRASSARLVAAADQVIVSTDELAGRVRAATGQQEITTVPNALDPRLWKSRVRGTSGDEDGVTRILYFGSRTHDRDLALLEAPMAALRSDLGDQVELVVVGVTAGETPAWATSLPVPKRAREYPRFVPWLRSNAHQWTVGVAPLVDDDFNRAKSELKLLEYAGLGLQVVASNVGPYRDCELLAHLVPNTTDAWTNALRNLVDAARSRPPGVRPSPELNADRMLPATNPLWLQAVLGDRSAKP